MSRSPTRLAITGTSARNRGKRRRSGACQNQRILLPTHCQAMDAYTIIITSVTAPLEK